MASASDLQSVIEPGLWILSTDTIMLPSGVKSYVVRARAFPGNLTVWICLSILSDVSKNVNRAGTLHKVKSIKVQARVECRELTLQM